MENKYWLYIEPTVFIFKGKSEYLFYDSDTLRRFKLSSTSSLLKNIIDLLLNLDNTYCIPISNKMLDDHKIMEFINLLRSKYMGDLLPINNPRPIIIPPFLKCHAENKKWTIEKSIIPLLNEITFYINGDCDLSCNHCLEYYQQILCCHKSNNELSIKIIKEIIERVLPTVYNIKLNFLGGNICLYSQINNLLNYLSAKKLKVNFYLNYQNLTDNFLSKILTSSNILHLYVEFPIKQEYLCRLLSKLKDNEDQIEFVFIVTSTKEVIEAVKLMNNFKITHYTLKPFYNKKNISFFEEHIYMTEKDLEEQNPKKIELFRKQLINLNYMGKLIVSNDGYYYISMQKPAVGSVTEDIASVIEREWENNNLWKFKRIQHPCDKCIYQLLCPSPSDYEFAIGKTNLCKY